MTDQEKFSELCKNIDIGLDDTELDVIISVIDDFDLHHEINRVFSDNFESNEITREFSEAYDDRCHAIDKVCYVDREEDGVLSEFEVGVKDNISIAGIPSNCNTELLDDYVPNEDSTVVSRILNSGGTITAKLRMDALAGSSSGEIIEGEPILNPHNDDYLAGGSSGGSAVAVSEEIVDASLGTDQGGSVRIPAACCGVIGLKPTYGLVPYTGTLPYDPTVDHIGILSNTIEECEKVLQTISGPDGRDIRAHGLHHDQFFSQLNKSAGNLRFGILEEGFEKENVQEDIRRTCMESLDVFDNHSEVNLESVSVPIHEEIGKLSYIIYKQGLSAMITSSFLGPIGQSMDSNDIIKELNEKIFNSQSTIPDTIKYNLAIGQCLQEKFGYDYYNKVQRLIPRFRESYDKVFDKVDIIAMPTISRPPLEVKNIDSMEQAINRAWSMSTNTAQFNLTGHPAISLPCGTIRNIPVGIMFVTEMFKDDTLLRVSRKFLNQHES